MRAAVLYGKEDVRLEEVSKPSVGLGEVLVRVQSALTCGTDLKVFRRGYHARMIQPPALFGHEFSGVIEAVGGGVKQWKPGMRVVAANSSPCGSCFFCRKEQPNLCEDLLFVNGAYAESLLLPARIVEKNLLEIPGTLSFQAAALTEPLACVVHGIETIQPQLQETAILLGAGPIGLLFAQLLVKAGVNLIVLSGGKERLRKARQIGASQVFDLAETKNRTAALLAATPEGKGADLVIEAVGLPSTWSEAVAVSRPGGRVLLFGGCPVGTQVTLDTHALHYEERRLASVFHHTPNNIRKALNLLAEGTVQPEHLITQTAPLGELPGILQMMLTQEDAVKTEITP